jgi:hypothetical protein
MDRSLTRGHGLPHAEQVGVVERGGANEGAIPVGGRAPGGKGTGSESRADLIVDDAGLDITEVLGAERQVHHEAGWLVQF